MDGTRDERQRRRRRRERERERERREAGSQCVCLIMCWTMCYLLVNSSHELSLLSSGGGLKPWHRHRATHGPLRRQWELGAWLYNWQQLLQTQTPPPPPPFVKMDVSWMPEENYVGIYQKYKKKESYIFVQCVWLYVTCLGGSLTYDLCDQLNCIEALGCSQLIVEYMNYDNIYYILTSGVNNVKGPV